MTKEQKLLTALIRKVGQLNWHRIPIHHTGSLEDVVADIGQSSVRVTPAGRILVSALLTDEVQLDCQLADGRKLYTLAEEVLQYRVTMAVETTVKYLEQL